MKDRSKLGRMKEAENATETKKKKKKIYPTKMGIKKENKAKARPIQERIRRGINPSIVAIVAITTLTIVRSVIT